MIEKLDLKDKIILYLSEKENYDKDTDDNFDDFLNHIDKDKKVLKNYLA